LKLKTLVTAALFTSMLAGPAMAQMAAPPPGGYGAYDEHHQWHDQGWWYDNHPDWVAKNHPGWGNDGDWDEHHHWHNRHWWMENHPKWVHEHHPHWFS
jgi:hypothetical protein